MSKCEIKANGFYSRFFTEIKGMHRASIYNTGTVIELVCRHLIAGILLQETFDTEEDAIKTLVNTGIAWVEVE